MKEMLIFLLHHFIRPLWALFLFKPIAWIKISIGSNKKSF